MPCAAVAAAVVDAVVDKLVSVLDTELYVANVPTGGDNIKTPADAKVILIVISPYTLVSKIEVEALPPRIPNH